MTLLYQSIDEPLICPSCKHPQSQTAKQILGRLDAVTEECEHCYEVIDITNEYDGSVQIESEGQADDE